MTGNDEIGPLRDPLLKQSDVAAFHQLETTTKVGCDPTVHELQTVGHEPALLMEAPVHGLGVLVAELLDHHEQHDKSRPLPKLHHAAARDEEYGEERVLSIVEAGKSDDPGTLLKRMMSALDLFVGNTPQHDDVTCMLLKSQAP